MKVRLAALALVLIPITAFAQGRDPIAGAWEEVSFKIAGNAQQLTPPPLHVIFSDGYYVQFTAAAGRAKIDTPRTQMTKEQLVERSNMQGQYGTYRVAGNKVTRKIVSAAAPNNEGREVMAEFRVEGDTLIVTGTNAQGQTTETRFKRLRQTT